jgi:dTDP-4-dehydrorhamnose reductase
VSRLRRALITGARGQLGRELQARAPAGWDVAAWGSGDLDVTERAAVSKLFQHEPPELVIHTAAYTDVDAAEEQAALAQAVNCVGAANVARAAAAVQSRMIHVSTDFVFDGRQGHPYVPEDTPNPLNVYGRSKLAGEREVARITAGHALIVRTAWVYSEHGDNFVHTMLRLMRARTPLTVVADQVGTPTWARALADALWIAAERPTLQGILHWTDAGVASWYDYAVAIQEEALQLGLLTQPVPIQAVRSADFPRPARRPSYSILDKTSGWAALQGPAGHWRANLRSMLQALSHA